MILNANWGGYFLRSVPRSPIVLIT